MLYKEGGILLADLGNEPLNDIICFLCYNEKKKGDA